MHTFIHGYELGLHKRLDYLSITIPYLIRKKLNKNKQLKTKGCLRELLHQIYIFLVFFDGFDMHIKKQI